MASKQKTNNNKFEVFLTGATGFIGGSIFTRLIKKLHNGENFHLTALVKEKKLADEMSTKFPQVKFLLGSLDDSQLLEEAASKADFVINVANVDHLLAAKALIEGLKKHGKATGKKPILLQGSGTAVLSEEKHIGELSDKVWTDDMMTDLNAINPKAPHRLVELEVLQAPSCGLLDVAIVCPPMIYGVSDGPYPRHSKQVPLMIRNGIESKRAMYVGNGKNMWSNVHIADLADFYMILFDTLLKVDLATREKLVNKFGYYFCENGELTIKDIANKIEDCLFKHKIVPFSEASGISHEDIYGHYGFTEYNSRSRAERARKLGWKPKGAPLLDTISEEVAYWVEKMCPTPKEEIIEVKEQQQSQEKLKEGKATQKPSEISTK
jgi:nucleoside-diphosphate-sugar epimerase